MSLMETKEEDVEVFSRVLRPLVTVLETDLISLVRNSAKWAKRSLLHRLNFVLTKSLASVKSISTNLNDLEETGESKVSLSSLISFNKSNQLAMVRDL
ncbi:hypothetical protein WICPIJ_007811 [Wickerhamomyces pijperi]|uniref:Uncharacterized protein n=1 Tax=Wickerhamomyces pijperi TaxID=599730 RepID=A0A9P8TIW5_WICPI|nr:hypothetical protein WICPIJ_007811 [Wickerhamomyces pijperi]